MFKLNLFFLAAFLTSCNFSSNSDQKKTNNTALQEPSTTTTQSSPINPPKKLPYETYLSENVSGGRVLMTSDNSVWLIDPDSITSTSGWLGPLNLTINSSGDPNFPYMITNNSTKETVKAKLGTLDDIN